MSSSQLTFTPSFFRGVGIPPDRCTGYGYYILITIKIRKKMYVLKPKVRKVLEKRPHDPCETTQMGGTCCGHKLRASGYFLRETMTFINLIPVSKNWLHFVLGETTRYGNLWEGCRGYMWLFPITIPSYLIKSHETIYEIPSDNPIIFH